MITTNTVFILGAGASDPYNYPSSSELWHRILDEKSYQDIIKVDASLKKPKPTKDDLENSQKLIKKFKTRIHLARMDSIDFFLEQNPEFMQIGKLFIAHVLIQCEDSNNIYNSEENWYKYLLNTCMLAPFDKLSQNKVSFLTFNYDRSLEYFLYNYLKEGFSKTEDEVLNLLNNFKIMYLYGTLGPLPYRSSEGFVYSQKQDTRQLERYKHAVTSLNLIGDERTEHFNAAHELIKKAERICFLGFGYRRENLDRLNIKLMAGKEIIGSAYGLEHAERHPITKYFNDLSAPIYLGDKEDNTLQFLRKNFRREL